MKTKLTMIFPVGRVSPSAPTAFTLASMKCRRVGALAETKPAPTPLSSAAQHPTKICRETLHIKLSSESGSKLHALQTLARSCCAQLLREAFGVRPACRRFGVASSTPELLRRILSQLLALCAALTFLTHTTFAQTWQTVDDFQYVAGQSAENNGLAFAPNGTLFACGWGDDSSG